MNSRKSGAREVRYWVGEPLEPENLQAVKDISSLTKSCGKNCALWTGYYIEQLDKAQLDALENVEWIIDGPFEEDKKDISLAWRGSSNQHIYWHAPLGFFLDMTSEFDRKKM